MAEGHPNVFLLAADNSPAILPLLRAGPAIASSQDEHGYSLVHAAVSYNHLELLRLLIQEFHVDVNLKDEDGETALFVAETLDCAKVLVEELQADITVRSCEGKTAREKITEEGDFPEVAVYLRLRELESDVSGSHQDLSSGVHRPPPLPQGISVDFGSMDADDAGEVVDPDFRRRIEELASREDFEGEDGQQALRGLITEALRGEVGQEREVRQRTS